jgi:hypothetical protein
MIGKIRFPPTEKPPHIVDKLPFSQGGFAYVIFKDETALKTVLKKVSLNFFFVLTTLFVDKTLNFHFRISPLQCLRQERKIFMENVNAVKKEGIVIGHFLTIQFNTFAINKSIFMILSFHR